MPSIIKEESLAIDKMFSWCATGDEIIIIKKAIFEVKIGKGLYNEASKCKGDLHSLKFIVSEHTGLDQKAAVELGRALYRLVKPKYERERMIRAGIVYGTWVYTSDICQYPHHEKLNGKRFSLIKGARIGFFKRELPGQSVGCSCFIKPVLPF